MLRALLIVCLLSIPSCDALGISSGGAPEGQKSTKRGAQLPVSRNVGKVSQSDRRRPLELEVGQWTRHVIFHPGGKRTEFLRQVVAKGPDGVTLEVVNGQPDAGTVTQLLTQKGSGAASLLHLVSARVRMPNGVIKDISGPAMDATRTGYQKLLEDVRLDTTWSGSTSEVKVLAGDFEGCIRSPLETEFAGLEHITEGYFHPSVPIGGLVKGVDKEGHTVVELTGFGVDDAQSVIERKKNSD